jgi:hypothetical protein
MILKDSRIPRVQGLSKKLKNYKDLKAWQKSHHLRLKVYKAPGKFPKNEGYGVTFQMRKAAKSIPSNIAARYGRMHRV